LPRSQSMMSRKKRRDKLVTNDGRRDFQDRLFSSGSNIKELRGVPSKKRPVDFR